MAAILADDKFKWIFSNENDRIPIWILLKFVPRNPIDNRRQAIIWTNADSVHIYAALEGDELKSKLWYGPVAAVRLQ